MGRFVAMLATDPGLDFLASKPDDQTLKDLDLRYDTGGPATFGDAPTHRGERALFGTSELLVK